MTTWLREIRGMWTGRNDCASWYVNNRPWSPHPAQCQVPGCTVHPSESVMWSANPARDLTAALRTPAGEFPADTHTFWACDHHAALIGASAKATGVGDRVLVGGLTADRARWGSEARPVDPRALMNWLAGVPDLTLEGRVTP